MPPRARRPHYISIETTSAGFSPDQYGRPLKAHRSDAYHKEATLLNILITKAITAKAIFV